MFDATIAFLDEGLKTLFEHREFLNRCHSACDADFLLDCGKVLAKKGKKGVFGLLLAQVFRLDKVKWEIFRELIFSENSHKVGFDMFELIVDTCCLYRTTFNTTFDTIPKVCLNGTWRGAENNSLLIKIEPDEDGSLAIRSFVIASQVEAYSKFFIHIKKVLKV